MEGWELHHVGLVGFGDVLIPSWLPREATGLGRWEDEEGEAEKYGLLWPTLWRGHLGCQERWSRGG